MKGDGTLYKHPGSPAWYMQYFVGLRRVRESCRTTRKEVAKEMLRAATREARLGREPGADPLVSDLVSALLDWWRVECGKDKFARICESQWKQHLSPVFGHFRASRVTSDSLREYRVRRVAEGASQTTVNRELHTLRKAFRLAAKADPPKVTRIPTFTLTRENNARLGFATPEELDRLREAAAKMGLHARAAVELAVAWGWRRGELAALRVSDVKLSSNVVQLRTSKNFEPRTAPIGPRLRPLLEALVIDRPGSALLLEDFNFEGNWHKLRKAAGCPHLLFHDLRRTSARLKRAAGVDTSVIMRLMGWRSESMFRRYAIVSEGDGLVALQRQDEYEQAQREQAAKAVQPAQLPATVVN